MRVVVSVAVWVTSLLGVAACETPASDRPAVMRLRLTHVAEGPRGVRVAPDRLEALTGVPFRDAARFERVPEGDPSDGALPARLWFAVTEGAGDARRVSLSLVVDASPDASLDDRGRTRGRGAGALEANVQLDASMSRGQVDGQLKRGGPGIDGDALVREAMVLALGILDARVALRRGEVARVPALLASQDPQLVLLALEWVRREGAAAMLPDVLRALRHDHPDVVVAAMETVATIGGPEHVGAILHRAPLLQVASAFRLYETLGRLGGPEAEAFLGFARRNEEDPALRSAADRALQSARARPAAPDGHGARRVEATFTRGHWRRP